ncbi:MAG: MATE family efflux transporter [Pseudomonadota bacterium]
MDIIADNKTRTTIKVLLFTAVPVMIEQLSQILLGTADVYFAGRLGDNAIAAISLTNLFMNLFATFFTAVALGTAILISNYLGAKKTDEACLVMKQSVILGIILGLFIGLINYVFAVPLMRLPGPNSVIVETALPYFRIVGTPVVFMCITLIFSNGLRASGMARYAMMASLVANASNIIINVAFMKIGMGIVGIGLATTISRFVNMMILLYAYINGKNTLRIHISHWHINKLMIRKLIQLGAPIGLTQLSARFAILIHGSVILALGSGAYVANSITQTIDDYACIPSAGLEIATATLIGTLVGSKSVDKIRKTAFLSFGLTSVMMTAIGGVLAIFAWQLSGLFTQTQSIQAQVTSVLRFMFFFQWTSAFSHIMTSATQGTGDTKTPLYITLAGNIIFRIGAGYVLAVVLGMGLIGIWLGIVLDFLLRGCFLTYHFNAGKMKYGFTRDLG